MCAKFKIKKGDTVKVLAGDARGQQGKILSIITKDNKAIVEGINMASRHSKPSAKHPQGGIIKKEAPIHVSNLQLVEAKAAPAKAAKKKTASKKKESKEWPRTHHV